MMNEIANILGVEEATTETQGWFAAWMPAIKNIINKMTGDELTALDIKVEEIALHGYDEILQWRYVSWCYDADAYADADADRLAKKYNGKCMEQAMQDQFKKNGDDISGVCVLYPAGWEACDCCISLVFMLSPSTE